MTIMKRFVNYSCALIVFLTILNCNSFGQIKVFDNGYVGVNYTTSTPTSRFAINSTGYAGYQASIYNSNISTSGGSLITISEKGTGLNTHVTSLYSQTNLGSGNYLYGIRAFASSTTAYSTGRSYGIFAQAGNASSGYNYGVYGYLYGANYGAAVFGSTTGDVGLSQKWAGYFKGDTKVEGILWVNSTSYTSDEKFKTNISSLESSETISNILKINPVKYNLKQFEVEATGGDTLKVSNYYDESSQLFLKAKYGVIAQELQKLYPDLVYQDGEGNLGVDYTGLIPIMIKAMQAQQKKIEELEAKIDKLLTVQVSSDARK
ncbi:MAG: hypothetical protein C0408_04900 [Odoribacter sp.]|nr:hypothetical protein [Odoribacter sp.]